MKVVKMGESDYIFFINTLELNNLKESSLNGNFWNYEYPYDCFETNVILRLINDDDRYFSGGGGSNSERTEFWIQERITDMVHEKGYCMGVRYDNHGDKIDIINYEAEIKGEDISYRSLRVDLKLI